MPAKLTSTKLATSLPFLKAPDGAHLSWVEFRQEVLASFRIKLVSGKTEEELPSAFVGRLQNYRKDLAQFGAQWDRWQALLAGGGGFSVNSVVPPHLLPPLLHTPYVQGCVVPRMGREGLPLRSPSAKKSLYELPTPQPFFAYGFTPAAFDKHQQGNLVGALTVKGTTVDFNKGEVLVGRVFYCPFLTFERIHHNQEQEIETARNHCAVAGAAALRGQQLIMYKALGLKVASQPLMTFSCIISNKLAIISVHCVDEDGNYTMSPLCKFDLEQSEHYQNLQAWIQGIESWAFLFLLPRLKGALKSVNKRHDTPPPSPALSEALSIDTNADQSQSIMSALKATYPDVPWRQEGTIDTPINSSVAQCGTPLPTRQLRSLSFSSEGQLSALRTPGGSYLGPIRPDLTSASPFRPRFMGALSPLRSEISDSSSAPFSPCRPPSLSPFTPPPDAPTSAKSTTLVLQRRLDVAMSEVNELRTQVEALQDQLVDSTHRLETQLTAILDRLSVSEISKSVASSPDPLSDETPRCHPIPQPSPRQEWQLVWRTLLSYLVAVQNFSSFRQIFEIVCAASACSAVILLFPEVFLHLLFILVTPRTLELTQAVIMPAGPICFKGLT